MGSPNKNSGRAGYDAIDLAAYCKRIGYGGPREPTRRVLADIVKCHMATIPFEAIDVLLDRGISLVPVVVDAKLIAGRRGGYCFEHTSVLRRALRAIGFSVDAHLARVRVHGGLAGPPPAATHASLKVAVEGELWLADVGFGSFMPNEPLLWRMGEVQATDYGQFRLSESVSGWLLELWRRDRWSPLYEILDFNWQLADFEVANHYSATHPEAHFRRGLMVALTAAETRITLSGNRFKRMTRSGEVNTKVLDVEGLAQVLADEFGLPVEDDWQPLLARVASGTARS